MKKLNITFVLATLVFTVFGPAGVQHIAAQTKRLTCESSGSNYNYCRADTDNNVTLERKLSFTDCVYGSSWGYDKRGIWVDRGCRAEFAYGGGSGAKTAIAAGAVIGGLVLAGVLANKNNNKETSNYSENDVYHLGFRDGESDARAGRNNDASSHRYEYDSKYSANFSNGYAAGYTSINNEAYGNYGNAYNDGFARGAQDARSNYSSDYNRYRSQYNWNTETEFRRGYDAGYRDNRENWDYSGNNYSAVPNYFIGTFRGYTSSNRTWTDITIHSDGSIRIMGQNGDQSAGYYQNGAAQFPWGNFRLKYENNGFTAVDPNNRSASVRYTRVR